MRAKLAGILEHSLVFAGDMLPYGVFFLLTVVVGYSLGLEAAGLLSLAYVYVTLVTGLVCGPNLLSLRRRMPNANSPASVVIAALMLRTTVIALGAALVLGGIWITGKAGGAESIQLIAYLFIGRLFETAVDSPATSVQYLRGARAYFILRLVVFLLICGFTGLGVVAAGLEWVALSYALGSFVGLLAAIKGAAGLLKSIDGLRQEIKEQTKEFGRFFMATALFLATSRIHPIIIEYFSGQDVAGKFALVQSLFSVLGLAATGVAGVFFWSWNRQGNSFHEAGIPWRTFFGASVGGLILGAVGGLMIDFLFLKPLGSSIVLRETAWILCLATPLLLIQAMLPNLLVLQRRDHEMLKLSVVNAIFGLLMTTLLVSTNGLVGAALSVGASALVSSLIGVLYIRSNHG